jgi:tetratricopeptide (TPR) repeat protein
VALAALEGALRIGGYGHSTSLFEKVRLEDGEYLLNNENFGLRFFSPELNRWPLPVKMKAAKPPGTCRLFIFGESAAQGDPAPSFSASRYLEVLLREGYPGVNFEVVNLGITAISSHVILPMARQCAHAQGDLWILYMGNNEMIGPFGAATVFGAKAAPWPVARLGLALQTTRVGQLLVNLGRHLTRHAGAPRVWRGLDMFVGNQLAPEDPRKEVVYENFRRNLQDIVRVGRGAGAAMLLSTVAVNLKDCPPFASLNSPTLAPADREQFERRCAEGRGAQLSNDWKGAAADFGQALGLDPHMAEAQYREGQCLLHLGEAGAAADHFQKACDCDALVFRADSRINGLIRETARQMGGPGLALCDAAAGLPGGGAIAGEESFYEHVHLNFEGNYRLGRMWAGQAEGLLPDWVRAKAQGGWASQAVCEARLGLTDWNRGDVWNAERQKLEGELFSSQFNNAQRISDLTARLDEMLRRRGAAAASNARALYLDAIGRAPRDYMLHENYGEFLHLTGDVKQAALELKKAGELMPRDLFAFLSEGRFLEEQGEWAGARECFYHAVKFRPRYAEAWLELGKLAALEGNLEEAMEDYRRSAALQPDEAQAFLYMGETLARLQRLEEAARNMRHALQLNGEYLEAHYALGEVLGLQGRVEEAKEEFEQVVRLQPQFAKGHLNLGIALLKLNDREGARREFAETLRLEPANQSARAYLTAASQ